SWTSPATRRSSCASTAVASWWMSRSWSRSSNPSDTAALSMTGSPGGLVAGMCQVSSRTVGDGQHPACVRQADLGGGDQGRIILEIAHVPAALHASQVHAHMLGAEAQAGRKAHVGRSLPRISVCIRIGPNAPAPSEVPRAGAPFGAHPHAMDGPEGRVNGIILHSEIISADAIRAPVQPRLAEIGEAIVHRHQAVLAGDEGGRCQHIPWGAHTVVEGAVR